MSLHHMKLNESLMDNLMRDDVQRARDGGLFDAYAYVVQMIRHNETIGKVDYKKAHKMKEGFPTLYE